MNRKKTDEGGNIEIPPESFPFNLIDVILLEKSVKGGEHRQKE